MSTRLSLVAPISLAALLVTGLNAQAADGTITFNGEIVAANCTIPTADTSVTLPKISTGAFGAAGTRAGQKAFQLALTCTAGTTGAQKVSVRFTGDDSQVDPTTGLFLLDATSTAKNVGIAVYDANDAWVKAANNDSTPPVDIVAGTGTTVIPLTAWYQSTAAAVTAGTVKATGAIEIIYQ
ncbi:type 1 fimbrial protein [Halomonas denitrificans]|uniref:fimbrial protein n=1 Tax=Halomonas TaxID=2745 RepID=UPI001A8D57E0|nr:MULTISPECIES: fimbrial protein [Halomonas]MED5294358.1 fimbrial protein [Pseudomonadota bacterium]MBN8413295.1 type 1 fimbrial protein [Halomonas litopenaei]MBY5928301.1 type 1 fimbrial protein [Halomonas sp. DP8Y7-3]MBY6029361.1 type 1 fimbrial protein [Halomonas sp. DP8Y7-1]MCA0974880.1 type 1 fimbrial protein [Halomonas denitrificans]